MIIKKLLLNNFRIFQGVHQIELTPETNKPIILLGGLNGSGKTSILTAIRLALYGKMAFENVFTQQEYINQLSELINKKTLTRHPQNETSIELTFTYNKDGTASDFTIIRKWTFGKKDKLSLLQNGTCLNELNYDQCQGFLNELIPHGVADLFFFDGEKIAELAEDTTGKLLKSAIRRLFGLDLIDKLSNDLIIYIKRNQIHTMSEKHKSKLNQLEEEKTINKKKAEELKNQAYLLAKKIDSLSVEIKQDEKLLFSEGAAFATSKQKDEIEKQLLQQEKENTIKAIKQEFENTLPLTLAPSLLKAMLNQLKMEIDLKKKNNFLIEIESFLTALTNDINSKSDTTSEILSQAIQNQLSNYLNTIPNIPIVFDISEREFGKYEQMVLSESVKSHECFKQIKNKLKDIELKLEQIKHNSNRAPDDEQLTKIYSKITTLNEERNKYINDYNLLLEKSKEKLLISLQKAREIQKFHDLARIQFDSNNALENANKTVNFLDEYSKALRDSRISALEANFLAAYKRLNRKENENLKVNVDKNNFNVELINPDGQIVSKKSLSAGEKQIFAIAILEALGKTSGKELPIIIDTPLGRLDSNHRQKLIEHYFPCISKQVIILSTDTEIDENYFNLLKNKTSHCYRIEFNDLANSSEIKSEYFWNK